MKRIYWIASILILLIALYLLGPAPARPQFGPVPAPAAASDLRALEAKINTSEAAIPGIKPDNEARIVWADSFAYKKTPYSLVYLHGFSASQGEGRPTHLEFAQRYGCNLYLARLQGHGIETQEPLLDLSPENLYASAREALAIGQQIGERVILMSTSTGGTLSLMLAAEYPDIAGQILYSPNIDLYDDNSSILIQPWGLYLARAINSGKYRQWEGSGETPKYWTTRYRVEALVALKALVAATMTPETFASVNQPVFLGYYYKNETEQDQTVSVPRMLEMFDQLATPAANKRKVAFPNVADHVIASEITSKDRESVRDETFRFAEEVLGLVPVSGSEEHP